VESVAIRIIFPHVIIPKVEEAPAPGRKLRRLVRGPPAEPGVIQKGKRERMPRGGPRRRLAKEKK
jgi:hypothetical protein